MAVSHSSSIVTNGLVLCLDAANPKSYNTAENLLQYSSTVAAVAVYNRVLSALEIQQNFTALRGRFSI